MGKFTRMAEDIRKDGEFTGNVNKMKFKLDSFTK